MSISFPHKFGLIQTVLYLSQINLLLFGVFNSLYAQAILLGKAQCHHVIGNPDSLAHTLLKVTEIRFRNGSVTFYFFTMFINAIYGVV